MADRADDAVLKKGQKSLAEAFKYSDPMSHDSLAPAESKIAHLVAGLETAATADPVSAQGQIKEIESALNERNRKAKLLK
jgi:hypothetical protein